MNHFMPFLWVHGESEERYRQMIGVIQDANIEAFCVEARPHPDFVQDKWWHDMDVILDEAKKRGMKVWILDDKHFPTGYAAGMVEKAPLALRRRAITHSSRAVKGGQKVSFDVVRAAAPKEDYGPIGLVMVIAFGGGLKAITQKLGEDEVITCLAHQGAQTVDLMPYVKDRKLTWQVPEGDWTIEICGLSYNSGMHRSYINMMDMDSCRIQIDAVYEPHYAHYADKFGKVIAGFFSDEPELGNGVYIRQYNILGRTTDPMPYSDALGKRLQEKLGEDWAQKMPLLWSNDFDPKETAKVRYIYMDQVTRLVEECFSAQIGNWCWDHGVEYIGHCIEDNNQHARTGTSLGHYFRGLKWQSMAGIDDIGGQVQPGGENIWKKNLFGNMDDGEFYHFALGKLGSSMGALNPNMQGRTMCEIFGNYRWEEGVYLEKYLLDHFMVRGVNYYVPHAFTCKDYPDSDCPPHFYAQGHNPQYRHFGALMQYGQRVCDLISDGRICQKIAILYHGEAEWTGRCMLMQKPARILAEHQIDFVYLPSDVFEEREFYHTQISDTLTVNGNVERLVIVPYAQYLTKACAEGLSELLTKGGKVLFLEALPDGIATGEALPENLKDADVRSLSELLSYVQQADCADTEIRPANPGIRVLHYQGGSEICFIVNETDTSYTGEIIIPGWQDCTGYDAWNDSFYNPSSSPAEAGLRVSFRLDPHHSTVLVKGSLKEAAGQLGEKSILTAPLIDRIAAGGSKTSLSAFELSVCKNPDYPNFIGKGQITECRGYEKKDPKFSGILRYAADLPQEAAQAAAAGKQVILEITEASEGVEVFLNQSSLGLQVTPRYLYDLTSYLKEGANRLTIEVATTLERERGGKKARSGITGEVNLWTLPNPGQNAGEAQEA